MQPFRVPGQSVVLIVVDVGPCLGETDECYASRLIQWQVRQARR